MREQSATHPFDLGAEAFEASKSLSANPFLHGSADADAWVAGWRTAAARANLDLPNLAPDPPRSYRAPASAPLSAPGPLRWAVRVLAFCIAWFAEARAAYARETALCSWVNADRWSAVAAVSRIVAKRPTLRVFVEALRMHLPPDKA